MIHSTYANHQSPVLHDGSLEIFLRITSEETIMQFVYEHSVPPWWLPCSFTFTIYLLRICCAISRGAPPSGIPGSGSMRVTHAPVMRLISLEIHRPVYPTKHFDVLLIVNNFNIKIQTSRPQKCLVDCLHVFCVEIHKF